MKENNYLTAWSVAKTGFLFFLLFCGGLTKETFKQKSDEQLSDGLEKDLFFGQFREEIIPQHINSRFSGNQYYNFETEASRNVKEADSSTKSSNINNKQLSARANRISRFERFKNSILLDNCDSKLSRFQIELLIRETTRIYRDSTDNLGRKLDLNNEADSKIFQKLVEGFLYAELSEKSAALAKIFFVYTKLPPQIKLYESYSEAETNMLIRPSSNVILLEVNLAKPTSLAKETIKHELSHVLYTITNAVYMENNFPVKQFAPSNMRLRIITLLDNESEKCYQEITKDAKGAKILLKNNYVNLLFFNQIKGLGKTQVLTRDSFLEVYPNLYKEFFKDQPKATLIEMKLNEDLEMVETTLYESTKEQQLSDTIEVTYKDYTGFNLAEEVGAFTLQYCDLDEIRSKYSCCDEVKGKVNQAALLTQRACNNATNPYGMIVS